MWVTTSQTGHTSSRLTASPRAVDSWILMPVEQLWQTVSRSSLIASSCTIVNFADELVTVPWAWCGSSNLIFVVDTEASFARMALRCSVVSSVSSCGVYCFFRCRVVFSFVVQDAQKPMFSSAAAVYEHADAVISGSLPVAIVRSRLNFATLTCFIRRLHGAYAYLVLLL